MLTDVERRVAPEPRKHEWVWVEVLTDTSAWMSSLGEPHRLRNQEGQSTPQCINRERHTLLGEEKLTEKPEEQFSEG